MLFTITFLAINEKKTNPNGQCSGNLAISKDKSPNYSLFLVFMAQI